MRIMNKIYYLVMSMTVILLAACSQDEMEQVKEGALPELRVMVNHPSSISTRASVNGEATTFTEGDKIGIFATDQNGEPIYINIPYICENVNTVEKPVYKWVPADEEKKAYYSPNFSYYAYYPYMEHDNDYWYNSLYFTSDNPTDFFESFIDTWELKLDQSTLENFNASDLMVGKGTDNSEIASVAFTLDHQMGLVRMDYNDGPNYIENLSDIDSKTYFYDASKGEENCPIPYNTGRYFYYITKPGTTFEFWCWGSTLNYEQFAVDVDARKGYITNYTIHTTF